MGLDAIAAALGGGELVGVELPRRPPEVCGVYFLTRRGECVYVGSSTDVLGRIGQHVRESEGFSFRAEPKSFDGASYHPCPESELAAREERLIRELKPEYNRTPVAHRKAPRGKGAWAAGQHATLLRECADTAFRFLAETDEASVGVLDLYDRVTNRVDFERGSCPTVWRLGVTRFTRVIRDDGRFDYDENTRSFRLRSPSTAPA
jgi:predicted GIY-YIG superfamily endonuclease